MGLITDAEGWLFQVAAKKVIIKVITIVVAWLLSGVVAGYLTQAGITVDPVKFQAYLTGAAMAGLKILEDYVNLRYHTNL
jgi:hypothetical protein